jgi:NADH dehydrogenase FAD-containing subunit
MLYLLSFLQHTIILFFHLLTANLFRREQQHQQADLSSSMKNIVIVGGSFAGVSAAHRILKQAAKTSPPGPFKVTLVSRDSHFYWNIAAPRGLLPGQISDEQLFQPIAAGFATYPAAQFEFMLATATGIDIGGKKLEIISGPDGESRKIDYDYLILGTGSRTTADSPFKSRGSTEATKEALHEYQQRIKQAKKIVIVGAGPTGVETSGELAFEYGRGKDIMLVGSVSSCENKDQNLNSF